MNHFSNAAPKWSNLQVFSVEAASGSHQLYANGRQQVGLLVKIQVIDDNGTPVKLTDEEVASVKLIEHGNSRAVTYEWFATPLLPRNAWHWSRHYNTDYKFFPGSNPTPNSNTPGGAGQHEMLLYFYLRTTSLRPIRLALQVTRKDGEVFQSNNPDIENGSITLSPVEPRQYQPGDYSFNRTVIQGDPDSTTQFDGHDYYPLELYENGVRVEFNPFTFNVTPRNIFRFDIAPKTRGSYTSVVRPGNHYFLWDRTFNFTGSPTVLDARYVKPGGIVVMVVRRNRAVVPHQLPSRDTPMVITVMDVYGNEHTLRIKFKGNGRKYLELV